jgi:hypothetical protein
MSHQEIRFIYNFFLYCLPNSYHPFALKKINTSIVLPLKNFTVEDTPAAGSD